MKRGVLEYWSIGVLRNRSSVSHTPISSHSNTPTLQHSNTPILHSPALCLLLAAALLRFFRLGHQSLWFDEVFSLTVVQGSLSDLLRLALKDAVHPPLYYFALYPFSHLSASEIVVRLPSALFGIAAVPLVYELGRRCVNERVGIVAAVLTLLSPFQIYYAQEARMYSMLLTLTILSLLTFWQACETGQVKWWIGFVVVTVAGLYTHYLMAAVVAAELLWSIGQLVNWSTVRNPFHVSRFNHGITAFACIAVLYSPWLYSLLRHGQSLSERNRFGSVPEANAAVIGTFLDFTFGYFQGLWLFARWHQYADVAFAVLSLGLVGAAIVFVIGVQQVLRVRFARGFLFLAFIVPIAAGYLLACKTYYHQTRYFIAAYPAFAILFAAGLTRLYDAHKGLGYEKNPKSEIRNPKSNDAHKGLVQRGGSSSSPVILSVAKNLVVTAEILRCAQNDKLLSYFRRAALCYAVVTLLGLITLVSLGNYYFAYSYSREDWRGAARYVRRHAQPGDLLVFDAPYMDIPFRHYEERHSVREERHSVREERHSVRSLRHVGLPRPEMTSADVERILSVQLKRHSRVWLVLCYWQIGDPDEMVRRCLDKLCVRQRWEKFASVDVLLYQDKG